nr:hypothetical protein [Lactiplantibacillus plantarum]
MADITHGTWIKDGKAVDKVFSDGKQQLSMVTAGGQLPNATA